MTPAIADRPFQATKTCLAFRFPLSAFHAKLQFLATSRNAPPF